MKGIRFYLNHMRGMTDVGETGFNYLFSCIYPLLDGLIWVYGDTSILQGGQSVEERAVIDLMARSFYGEAGLLALVGRQIADDRDSELLFLQVTDVDDIEQIESVNAMTYAYIADESDADYVARFLSAGVRFLFRNMHYEYWEVFCRDEDAALLDTLLYRHRTNPALKIEWIDEVSMRGITAMP